MARQADLVVPGPFHYRAPGELDGFQWYCENCGHQLHEEFAEITDIVAQLPPLMDRFWANDALRTCQVCGTYLEAPAPVQ